MARTGARGKLVRHTLHMPAFGRQRMGPCAPFSSLFLERFPRGDKIARACKPGFDELLINGYGPARRSRASPRETKAVHRIRMTRINDRRSDDTAEAALASDPAWRWAAQRAPQQQCDGRQHNRKHNLVHGSPAEARQQLAGRERADGHGAEDKEIVERLYLVALVRPVTVRDHGGGADKGKIPADSQQRQPNPEMPERNPGDPDSGGDDDQREPQAGDPLEPEAADERASDETRCVHA